MERWSASIQREERQEVKKEICYDFIENLQDSS